MDSAASYNARLCNERRLRSPFLDSQTGVAQNHSNLWIPYRYRDLVCLCEVTYVIQG